MSASNPSMPTIILAGGAATRMGTDKLALQRGGKTLLDTVIDATFSTLAAAFESPPIVVVGPEPDAPARPGVSWTREQPPGGGPVAAIAAGLAQLSAPPVHPGIEDPRIVAILAGDAPDGPRALPLLRETCASTDSDGALLIDGNGRRQPLCAVYRRAALIRALADLGAPDGRSLQSLLGQLRVIEVPDAEGYAADIDTPADATRLGFRD